MRRGEVQCSLARTSGSIVRPWEVHVHQHGVVRKLGHPVACLALFRTALVETCKVQGHVIREQ